SGHLPSSDNRGLPVLQCSAFGLQALQDIELRQRPTCLLVSPPSRRLPKSITGSQRCVKRTFGARSSPVEGSLSFYLAKFWGFARLGPSSTPTTRLGRKAAFLGKLFRMRPRSPSRRWWHGCGRPPSYVGQGVI